MATELKREGATLGKIEELLGADARTLLDYTSKTIPKEQIQIPGPDFIDRVWSASDRSPRVLLLIVAPERYELLEQTTA